MSAVNTSTRTNGSAGVKSNFPVDFSLYDKNLHYVLYITDDPTKEHRLMLELNNSSNQKISFDALPGPTSGGNCNFELRLRNGTLSDQTLQILRKASTDPEIRKLSVLSKDDQNDWDIYLDEGSSGTSAYVSLYFRSLRSEAVSLDINSVMILNLEHISADAGSGARGTRVEFIPHLIRFSDDNSLVTGNREQHLFITNHSGQKHIPLHVGFVGTDRILSEGANQKLTVRITNVASNQDINLIPSTFDSPTFVIEFDYHADWGFGSQDEIKAINIDGKEGWKAERRDLVWNIYHPNPPALKPDAYIEFNITSITTSGSSGFALLYIYYQHIAGYWDGHFVLTAEKTPLMFSGNNVGIGIKDPTIRLALGDNDTGLDQKGDGRLTFLTNGSERARIDETGNVGIGTPKPGGTLDLQKVGTDKRQSDLVSNAFPYGAEAADLVLTHEISRDYSLNGQSAALIDFRAVYSWPGGQAKWSTAQILGVSDLNTKGYAGGLAFLTSPGGSDNPSSRNQNDTRNNGAAPITRLVIDARGNIGIGTIYPANQLHIKIPNGPLEFNQAIRVQTNDGDFSVDRGGGIITQNADVVTAGIFGIRETNSWQGALSFYTHTSGNGNTFGSTFTEKMRISSDGSVGVGTTTPQAKLNVINAEQDANGNTLILGSTDKSNLRLGYHTDYSWIQSHGAKPLTINPIGNNVGIGTTNPVAKVDIQAVTRTDLNNHPKAVNGLYVTGNFDADQNGVEFRHTNGSQGIGFGYNTIYAAGSNATQHLNLLPKGNVGIGTTNPTNGKLHVDGDIYSKGALFVEGGLFYYWGPDGRWKNIQNRADNWAGSYDGRAPSDVRFKKDIKGIEDALIKVLQLRGTYFQWAETGLKYLTRDVENMISAGPTASEDENRKIWDAERKKEVERLAGNQIGLIAQDVELVVPEVVHTDAEGNKFLDYGHITALLVEAIKEQNMLIQDLTSKLNALEKG